MKNFTLLILFTFCLYGCTDKKKVNDSQPIDDIFNGLETYLKVIDTKSKLSEQNLQGNVKYISESDYEATYKFGEIEKSKLICRYYTQFDKFGKKKLGKEKSFGEEIKYVNNYDANNNIIETNFYKSDTILAIKIKYKYDQNGNEIEKCTYGRGDIIAEKKIFQYNLNNDIIEENLYNSKNKLSSKIKYKYDIRGNKIEESEYNSDGSLFKKITIKYDIMNRNIETNWDESDGEDITPKFKNQKSTYKYDGKGNIIETKYYKDGVYSGETIYKYDGRGNIIEDNSGIQSVESYKEEYDKNGNWIKKITFYNDEPKEIKEREIKYY
jgi:hypothetical protein